MEGMIELVGDLISGSGGISACYKNGGCLWAREKEGGIILTVVFLRLKGAEWKRLHRKIQPSIFILAMSISTEIKSI